MIIRNILNNLEIKSFLIHDINAPDENGNTPLHRAIDAGNVKEVEKLLKYEKIDVNLSNQQNERPIEIAIKRNKLKLVEILLKCEKIELRGFSLFIKVIGQKNQKIIQLLLKDEKIDVNENNIHGSIPLQYTALQNNSTIFKKLLNHPKIDINKIGANGNTALHSAINYEKDKSIYALLEHQNINVNAIDGFGNTPLHCAAMLDDKFAKDHKLKIIELLFEKHAHVNIKNKTGDTFLHILVRLNKEISPVIKLLKQENIFKTGLKKRKFEEMSGIKLPNNIDFVALLNDQNALGNTPLHEAVSKQNEIVVKNLLSLAEIDPNLRNLEGKTPLMIAKEKKFERIEQMIIDKLQSRNNEMSNNPNKRKRI